MIVDPPVLTIRAKFPRPAREIVEGFAGAPTGNVVDAMGGGGALDHRIKPLPPSAKIMVGVALTCDCGPSDNLALFGALSVAQPGDILVAAAHGHTGAAVTGDLMLGMARNRGVKGFVTDGMVRDIVGILDVGLPVYCAGVTPNSPARNGPGTVGQPVDLGGLRIESGDILIGDRDGIVVVPRDRAAAVLKALAEVRAAEAALEAKVKGGLEIPDFVVAILASDRVRNIE
ncbi:RraA family protein [Methylocapsa sp. S129]|uniref:RraA family protein n=1 Tax=Methylocapsa sp. S129 TaxID=1641869 RepID=UPI00131B6EE7|nr:RraA family protein [Methylocapsa sp. S129]